MPNDAMPVTALAVLFLVVSAIGIVGAVFVAAILGAIYRERRDIRRAKAVAKAKQEMKDRARRLKEAEARESAKDDELVARWKELIDGL